MTLTNDELRKAVDAAPGWILGEDIDDDNGAYIEFADDTTWLIGDMPMYLHDVPPIFIAALASALVELVDADKATMLVEYPLSTLLYSLAHTEEGLEASPWHREEGPNRNENTIRAVLAWLESKDAKG